MVGSGVDPGEHKTGRGGPDLPYVLICHLGSKQALIGASPEAFPVDFVTQCLALALAPATLEVDAPGSPPQPPTLPVGLPILLPGVHLRLSDVQPYRGPSTPG